MNSVGGVPSARIPPASRIVARIADHCIPEDSLYLLSLFPHLVVLWFRSAGVRTCMSVRLEQFSRPHEIDSAGAAAERNLVRAVMAVATSGRSATCPATVLHLHATAPETIPAKTKGAPFVKLPGRLYGACFDIVRFWAVDQTHYLIHRDGTGSALVVLVVAHSAGAKFCALMGPCIRVRCCRSRGM